MATILKNVLTFVGVLPGATSANQAHGLVIEDVAVTPNIAFCSDPKFLVTVVGANVNVTNKGSSRTTCTVLLEHWHSQEIPGGTLPATMVVLNGVANESEALALFGNGADGDVAVGVGGATLARDMYYNNLTLDGGGVIDTAGFRIFCRGTLTVTNGTLGRPGLAGADGAAGVGGAAGAALAAASIGGTPGAGGAGANAGAGAGAAGTAVAADGIGAAGGAGGLGSGGAGGAAGALAAPAATTLLPNAYPVCVTMVGLETAGAQDDFLGGSGGGGGGDGGATGGGGGGGGGGVVMIAARSIVVAAAGIITAAGGAGGDGEGANAGGGGGGGGGAISLVFAGLSNLGSITVAGGAGGAGVGTGVNGTAGTAGTIYQMPVSL